MTKRTDDMRSLLNILKDSEKTPLKENALGSVVGGIAGGAVGEFVAGPVGAGFGSELGSSLGGSFGNSSDLDESVALTGAMAFAHANPQMISSVLSLITVAISSLGIAGVRYGLEKRKYDKIRVALENAQDDLKQIQGMVGEQPIQESEDGMFASLVSKIIDELCNAADMCATTNSLQRFVEPLHKASHWLDQISRGPEEVDEGLSAAAGIWGRAHSSASDMDDRDDAEMVAERYRKAPRWANYDIAVKETGNGKFFVAAAKKADISESSLDEEDEIDEDWKGAALAGGLFAAGLAGGAAGGMAYQDHQDNAKVARYGAPSIEDSGIVHHEEEPLAPKWTDHHDSDAPMDTDDGGDHKLWGPARESAMRDLINLVNEQTTDMTGADVRSNAFVPKSSPWETETSPMKSFQRWAPQAVVEAKSSDPLDYDIDLNLDENSIFEGFGMEPQAKGARGMTSYTPAFPAKGVEAEYYADFDDDHGWGVYGSETGHCYGLYNNQDEADKASLHMNTAKMNTQTDEELMEAENNIEALRAAHATALKRYGAGSPKETDALEKLEKAKDEVYGTKWPDKKAKSYIQAELSESKKKVKEGRFGELPADIKPSFSAVNPTPTLDKWPRPKSFGPGMMWRQTPEIGQSESPHRHGGTGKAPEDIMQRAYDLGYTTKEKEKNGELVNYYSEYSKFCGNTGWGRMDDLESAFRKGVKDCEMGVAAHYLDDGELSLEDAARLARVYEGRREHHEAGVANTRRHPNDQYNSFDVGGFVAGAAGGAALGGPLGGLVGGAVGALAGDAAKRKAQDIARYVKGRHKAASDERKAKIAEETFEGSPEDEAKDRAEAKKHGMTMAQWEKSPQDRKLDAAGQRKLDAKLTEWEDDDYEDDFDDDENFEPDFDPEFEDDLDFAEPGRNSALRAATRDDPRDQPCPTCGEDNRLTRRDVAHGYQCDACADRAERGW